jgi:hypothetical protein
LKNPFLGLAICAFLSSSASAATEYKDFAGQQCKKSELVKVIEIAKTGFTDGPMKGYINVKVTLPSGETTSAPFPSSLIGKLKIGDLACKATFLDAN